MKNAIRPEGYQTNARPDPMSSTLEFLTHLTSLGASVSLDGDDLILNAPRDIITSELRSELRSRKAELLLLLRSVKPQSPVLPGSRGDRPSFLSHAQQRIWFLSRLEPDNAIWNVATILHIRGRLDEHALSRALSEIVSRHGVLRSVFTSIDGVPQFSMLPPSAETLTIVRFLSADAARAEAHAAAVKPFDLSAEPAFRALLCVTPSSESFLAIAAHHIVCDGWSLGILARELSDLYQAFSRGILSPLPALACQYPDYVEWERQIPAETLNADLNWWKERLAVPLPVMQLPTDHPRSSRLETAGRRITAHLPQTIVDQLHEFARKQEVTPFMLLLAAFKILLFRYTGLEDILVGTVSSHRKRREFEPIIGMFANSVVLRTSLSQNPSFRDLLARVRDTVTSSFSHDTVPFDQLVESLHPDRYAIDSPLFQVSFVYQSLPIKQLNWEGIEIVPQSPDITGARYDISVEIWETDLGLSCDFEHRIPLFDAGTIERMQGNYLRLLESVLADCDTPIEHLDILTAGERQQLAVTWNGFPKDYPGQPIHALFEERCAESPDAVALIEGVESVTYKQLSLATDCIADRLLSQGVKVGEPVAILIDRSTYSVMAMLGILKAGGCYVPLDISYPEQRLLQLLSAVGVKYVLVTSASIPEWLHKRSEFVCLDVAFIAKPSAVRGLSGVSVGVSPSDLMCILFTSGSTGIPKGIEIVHRGVTRLLFSEELASFGERATVLHMAPEAFDASLLEIWGPLLHGGTCLIYPDLRPNIKDIARLLEKHGVTAAWFTASLFDWIIAEAPKTFAPLRQLYIGGEVLSIRHVRIAQQVLPDLQIFNGYGPTEATTFTCIYPIPPQVSEELGSLPIGRPISNTEVYVLDAHHQLVPVGVPGELYIGGDALARGYRNQPELTGEKFIANSITKTRILYRSGDTVRWLPDGNLEFIGRKDDQFKIRGHRVELSEIETAISKYPGVVSSAVRVERSSDRGDRIVAWFSADDSLQPADLRSALMALLPPYMVPQLLLPLRSMPLLPNGKIDRAALAVLPQPSVLDTLSPDLSLQGDIVFLIAQAMAELLGLQAVGPNDDFFSLGGHSLLALQLAARIESLIGQPISAALLFRASTPKAIALLLEDGQNCRPQSLVPLRPTGTLPVLFCIHLLAEGTIQQYLSLVRSLDRRVPVYALCPVDLGTAARQNISLQQIAEAHVLQIRRVRINSVYYICGYSSGGILAFEIAQQLRREGEQVTLILIDSFPPRTLRRILVHDSWKLLRLLAHPVAWKRIRDRLVNGETSLKGKTISTIRHLLSQSRPSPENSEDKLADALIGAMKGYTPYPYHGAAILFQSRDSNEIGLFNFDGFNNWGRFIPGGIQVRSIPGDHLQIMSPPYVKVLAEELLGVLSTPTT